MKLSYSLRMRLSILFFLTLIVPLFIIVFVMPSYYQRLITTDTTTLTESSLTSLTHNIETYLEDLERLTVTPYWSEEVMRALKVKANGQYETTDAYSQFLTDKALNVTLPNFLKNPRNDILGTILLSYDGSVYVTSAFKNEPVDNYPFTEQGWYKQAVEADGKVSFISAHAQDYLKKPTITQVFSVARLIKDPDSKQPLAVMKADADTIILEKIANDIRFNVNSIVAIFDEQHHLIYSTASLPLELQQKLIFPAPNGQTIDDYVVVSKNVTQANWNIVVLLDNSELKAKLEGIYMVGLLLAGGGIVLTLLVFFTLSRWIVKPFREMTFVMKRVQKGELHTRFAVRGKDEVAELGKALNTMIDQLKELIDSEYKAVLNQRDAEYRALQSQIQPHFLYNTLNGFIGLNRMGDRRLLEKSILSLSGMLRYILEHNDWSTVAEEMLFLKKYGELQQLRFQDRLTLDIYTDPATNNYLLPKLLLQPLVENAIIHGVEPLNRPCTLVMSCIVDHAQDIEALIITIKDDGAGFASHRVDESIAVGLANVRNRLQLAYEHATFHIWSEINQGTHVTITIPLREVRL
ncbi:HAMP domain-containing protein [Paenibacillus sp. LMG 31456]|uniref:HAMP domain-containing protein n=1 Tax=Paenibacillus foliorum TaxID=2654974 RepID=A0A972GQ04_9BACL|nr:sensor histidine kinase [Paenibacillus foliorum]NOU94273.1 HAMP domain-containing protein [Paenibacillus foliorum]